jgi:hypothetical protein
MDGRERNGLGGMKGDKAFGGKSRENRISPGANKIECNKIIRLE